MNMVKSDGDKVNFLDEIENFLNEIKKFENNFKRFDSSIDNKLEGFDDKINSLNDELTIVKEESDKTKQYLLLELESSLDKYHQSENKLENKYNELIMLLKDDSNNKISSLSEELGKYKQALEVKDKSINRYKNNQKELKDGISQNKKKIIDLTNKNNELEEVIKNNNELIECYIRLVKEKESEIDILSSKNEELSAEIKENNSALIDELNGKLIKLQDQVKSFDVKSEEFEGILAKRVSEIQNLNKLVSEKEEDIKALELSNSEKDNENSRLNDQLIKLQDEVKSFDVKSEEFEGILAKRDSEIEELNKVVSKKDNDIKGLKLANSDKDKLNNQLNDDLIKLQDEVKSLGVKSEEFEGILAEKDSEIEELNKVVSKKDNDIKGLRLVNADKNKINKRLNDKLIKAENKVEVLKDETNVVKLTFEEKENNIKLLTEEVKILESIIEEKDQNINLLRGR